MGKALSSCKKIIMKLPIRWILVTGLLIILATHASMGQVRWFDQYSHVTDAQEKLHLNDFAYYLIKDSDLLGYIAFRIGNKDKMSVVKKRAEHNKRYLVQKFKISSERIRLVFLGRSDNTIFILQPLERDKPFPTE